MKLVSSIKKISVIISLIFLTSIPRINGMDKSDENQMLLSAIIHHNIDKVKELLEKKANPNAIDPEIHITPLHAAARAGNISIIEMLIEAGANPNQLSGTNQITPLFAATCKGHLAIVKALLKANAEPNKPNKSGITPMQAAESENNLDIAKELFKYGAFLTSKNQDWHKKVMISMMV